MTTISTYEAELILRIHPRVARLYAGTSSTRLWKAARLGSKRQLDLALMRKGWTARTLCSSSRRCKPRSTMTTKKARRSNETQSESH